MPAEMLVDSDFLSKLLAGSMETAIGAVDEAVMANAALFGGEASELSTLATYADHFIVANDVGEFYRGRWAAKDGAVVLSEVKLIDVPVFEVSSMGPQVREEAAAAARALLDDDMETAEARIRSMYRLVKSGVRLTAEGVEDLYAAQSFEEDDWFKSVHEQGNEIRAFLGTDVLRLPTVKDRFAKLVGEATDQQAEPHRPAIKAGLDELHRVFADMRSRIAVAKTIDETHRLRDDGPGMAAAEFVEFVDGYSDALDSAVAVLADARAMAEDGCLKCLARIHDGLAEQMHEWSLAAAFCEKLGRRFVSG